MNGVLSIAGADAAERTRRFTFLLTIIAALYGGYLYAPDARAHYVTVAIDGHRGLYDSAWMGAITAVLSAAFLTLIGFFLVRGSIERDRELQTSDLVAASPVSKLTFVFGKFVSNLAVLAAIAALMYAAGIVMQLLRGEDRHIDVMAYIVPFVVVTFPSLAFVAALAIVFDLVKPLRGVLGGVVYVFVWTALFIVPLTITAEGTRWTPLDPFGTTSVTAAMTHGVMQAFNRANIVDITIGGGDVPPQGLTTFAFAGIEWSVAQIASRAAWLLLSLLLVVLGARLFDRYANESASKSRSTRARFDIAALIPNLAGLRLYRAELAILVNGASIYWWAGAVALAILSGTLNMDLASKYVLPIAFIWPIERWSGLGCRERRWGVEGQVAAAPHALVRTTFAQWAAAVTLGIAIAAGFILRAAIAGDVAAVVACVVAIGAITAAAIGAGAATGTSRLFEGAYLILWYLGPINHLAPLDFTGAALSTPLTLIAVSAVIASLGIGVAFAARIAARYA